MASKTSTKKATVHLTRPGTKRSMCGRYQVEQTDEGRKATCGSCKSLYEKNRKGYAALKRAAKKS
jgi:hypothetical protein